MSEGKIEETQQEVTQNEEKHEETTAEEKPKSLLDKPYSQKTFIERLLTPGTDDGILSFVRFSIFILMIFLVITYFLTWNIHFFIMSCLNFCLYFSFEYFVKQLREADLLNPEETKEKREREAAKKKAEENKTNENNEKAE